MFILYDLIFLIFALMYFPCLLCQRKMHRGMIMRMGFFPRDLEGRMDGRKNIWIHAVSVGEVMAISGLIGKMKVDFPRHHIILSTVTKTGHQLARSKLSSEDIVLFAPLDFSWIVRRYIQMIQPVMYITAETEIWPNLYAALFKEDVPIAMVNGRISDRAFGHYKKVRFLLKRILHCVKIFCMQSQMDAARIVALGADPIKVRVVGNTKFDDLAVDIDQDIKSLEWRVSASVWIAGSTHPGEEQIVCEIFKELKPEFTDLTLIIAPRHVDRAGEIEEVVKAHGFFPVRFSRFLQKKDILRDRNSVIIVDTIGHLRSLYQIAAIVFMGKSLTAQGGQNIIEPAFYGKPIFVGPHMENFKNSVKVFLEARALIQIKDGQELLQEIRKLLRDPLRMERMGRSAKEVVQKNQGATDKTLQIISQWLSN